jgi:hypothetical protein
MTIPHIYNELDRQIKPFNELFLELKNLQKRDIEIDTLSMGMSNDFEAAICKGATIVRIGSALFGKRV